jgi:hypothetical protein
LPQRTQRAQRGKEEEQKITNYNIQITNKFQITMTEIPDSSWRVY